MDSRQGDHDIDTITSQIIWNSLHRFISSSRL